MKLARILVLFSVVFSLIVCYEIKNILFNEFKDKTKSLDDLSVWRNKLRDDFKVKIKGLPESVKKSIIEQADNVVKVGHWDNVLAMEFLDFKLIGNNFRFNTRSVGRHIRLAKLVLAEMLSQTGKYMNEIANGMWLLMEQSTWVNPAHMGMQRAGPGLPDPKQIVIDIVAAETCGLIAWVRFLLGDKLTKIEPMFVKRTDYELNQRIIEPYLQNNFTNWMGLDGQRTNSWNSLINTYVLMTTLLTVNQTKILEVVNKIVRVTDKWLDWYGNDGGSDEGPRYWMTGGGRIIEFLYYLTSASNGKMDWSNNTLINNIGSYSYKMHIDKDYFVNFADATPTVNLDSTAVFGYGKLFNNTIMKQFGAYLYQLEGKESTLINGAKTGRNIEFMQLYYFQMISYYTLKDTTPKAPQPLESWFPDIQVVTLRSHQGSPQGLFLGAKFGNNGESHNHNDVGNFIVYVNGLPAIIDIGTATYIAKTFSKDRYEIWNLQSQWHNCPTINGVQQHDGINYTSKDVSYKNGIFEGNIAAAYPKEAHVDSWQRKVTFNRTSNSIEMSETYKLNKYVEPFKIHFITALKVTFDQNKGEVVLSDEKTKLVLNYNPSHLNIKLDYHLTNDQTLTRSWGQRINRVNFVSKQKDLEGKHEINFHL